MNDYAYNYLFNKRTRAELLENEWLEEDYEYAKGGIPFSIHISKDSNLIEIAGFESFSIQYTKELKDMLDWLTKEESYDSRTN
jgi:hypothetical protein